MNFKILSIDDDLNFLKSLKQFLELKGLHVETLSNSTEAFDVIQERDFDCILLDVKMPGLNGVDLLKIAVHKYPPIPVIMVSGQSNINIAVESLKNGAYDFIEKPVDPEKLFHTIKNALYKQTLTKEKENLLSELKGRNKLIGKSKQFLNLLNQVKTVADTPAKVLIYGETGTGKELIAWALHHNSSRKGNPYIKINCASIPAELLESELFGHKKGAFTGAHQSHIGKFIAADGGTLFLDEIGDMNIELQAKLLRVLEEDEVDIIGENKPRKIDVRFIAATNQKLLDKVEEGTFREDLFHRLNVVQIEIPPLRDRPDDVLPLAYHFISIFNEVYNKQVMTISRQVEGILLKQRWFGNIRELKNVIEKLIIFSSSSEIGISDFHTIINNSNSHTDKEIGLAENLKVAKSIFEKDYIVGALNKNNWKVQETAKALGIDRTNLFKKMQ
ncbi:MAG: sigma-54-dependent Fis family transcriptional regulator, partial [Ignavibacteriae bacterium]|nr:sigma-54-dependent Fis family transcriptional regulator [Ignavibacteriota bacterium]